MSTTVKPPGGPRPVAASSDDVDGVLRAFFRAQLPDPWPAPPVPAATGRLPAEPFVHNEPAAAQRRGTTLARSRWALAAGVLALILGHALLSRTVPEVSLPRPDRGTSQDVGTGPGKPLKQLPNTSSGAGSTQDFGRSR